MRRLYLRDCQAGDVIEDVFMLSNKQLGATNQGKPYIKAVIGDKTCQFNARMWNAGKEVFNALPDNGFVRIRGRVENYQNNNQFIIEQTWHPKEGSFEIGDIIPSTDKDVPTMCARLRELCDSIQNRHVAAIVQTYLDDDVLMEKFCRAPAAMSFHHAFLGGLLEHTLNAMEVADAIVKFYPGLNRDLLLAGIFLHDIGKTWELTYEAAFGYSDGGQLIGHIVKAVLWVEEKSKKAAETLGEPIPRELIEVLEHIILSHHDKPEFGSPKTPATPEAIAVHMIENMDAKLMMALGSCRGPEVGEGNWTEYMKAFGGRLYRPDVAPADVVEPAPAGGDGKMKITNPMFDTGSAKR